MQAKSIKATWSSAYGGGGCVESVGTKKCLAEGEDLNTIIDLAMTKAMKLTKRSKTKVNDASNSDDEAEHFNFEKLDIRSDSK